MNLIIKKPDVVLGWSHALVGTENKSQRVRTNFRGPQPWQVTNEMASAVFARLGEKPTEIPFNLSVMDVYVFTLRSKGGKPYVVTKHFPDSTIPVRVFAGVYENPQTVPAENVRSRVYHLYFAMAKGTKVIGIVGQNLLQTLNIKDPQSNPEELTQPYFLDEIPIGVSAPTMLRFSADFIKCRS
jgi:hypothetical protein